MKVTENLKKSQKGNFSINEDFSFIIISLINLIYKVKSTLHNLKELLISCLRTLLENSSNY